MLSDNRTYRGLTPTANTNAALRARLELVGFAVKQNYEK